jgi:hypothetical protein
MDEAKLARVRRVGSARGVCGVARLGRGVNHDLRRSMETPNRYALIVQWHFL